MISPELKDLLSTRLSGLIGSAMAGIRFVPQGGGSINEAYRVETPGGNNFFPKAKRKPALFQAFRTGKNGLDFPRLPEKIRVPALSIRARRETRPSC